MAAAKKKATVADAEATKLEMITLRLRHETKAHLHAHVLKRATKEARQISYNQAIIDLIHRSPV